MASSWIPPIPGGKLTSKPVRDLGSAVMFLHWCYEAVQRDGTIEFQIGDVAGYLEESYYTVRKWWSAVRDGPWFAEVTDRGKLGFHIRMADDWLEWRSVKSPSKRNEVPHQVLDEEKPIVKLPSTHDEAPKHAFEQPVYKEDHHDQESSPPTPTNGGGDGEFIKTLIREYNISPRKAQEIAATGVDPETCYQSIRNCVNTQDANSMGRLILRLLAAPPQPGKPYQAASSNGARAAPDTRPPLPIVQPDLNRPDPAESRRKTAELARQLRGT